MARERSGVRAVSAEPRTHSSAHPQASRNPPVAYLPQGPQDLVLNDGAVGEEAAELLHEFVHPHHHTPDAIPSTDDAADASDDDIEDEDMEWRQNLPWWKRPSPWWFIVLIPFSSIATGMTVAPKIELFTKLACEVLKPEYTDVGRGVSHSGFAIITDITRVFAGPLTDREKQLCASDPIVQAAVARLNMIALTTMGILSCLTCAWWGSLSDRYGRVRVMRVITLGLIVQDITMILVGTSSKYLPGGYWFILVGTTLEGLTGGLGAASAAIHAYISDCVDPGSRVRTFSLFLGLMFTGAGIGPSLGGLVVKFSDNLLLVFYVAASVHGLFGLCIWFLIPESISPTQMAVSRRAHKESMKESRSLINRLLGFITPLSIFLPVEIDGPRGKRMDWSLPLVIISYGLTLSILGSWTYKFQYAASTYGWTSEQIGYYVSTVGAVRAICLVFLLPLAYKLLMPKSVIELPIGPDEPLQPDTHPSSSSSSLPVKRLPSTDAPPHSPSFDLTVARWSLSIEMVAYFFLPFAPNAVFFTLFTVLASFGTGFSPALHGVALSLFVAQGGTESGKLFGAMSVVQTLSASILAPALYGITYMKTVATFPKAIFFFSLGSVVLAFVVLAFVRLYQEKRDIEDQVPEHPHRRESEYTLVDQPPLIIIEDEDSGIKPAPNA